MLQPETADPLAAQQAPGIALDTSLLAVEH